MKIAIASGKGGTGKTTLATNLAHLFAQSYQVALADLDVEEPDSGLFLSGRLINNEKTHRMVPEWDAEKCLLCGDCQRRCNFNAIIQLDKIILVLPLLCHSCHACSEMCPVAALPMKKQVNGLITHTKRKTLDFVEGRMDVGEEQAVPVISQTKKYVHALHPSVNFILYDSPPGTSCPVIEVTKDADFVILVTEPTPFGLHDLKLAVETMRKITRPFAVVINRDGMGDDNVTRYCEMEGIEIIARIPNNRVIAEHYSRGELIYQHVPEFRKQLIRIKKYILTLNQINP